MNLQTVDYQFVADKNWILYYFNVPKTIKNNKFFAFLKLFNPLCSQTNYIFLRLQEKHE
jgi:hypothetical protein